MGFLFCRGFFGFWGLLVGVFSGIGKIHVMWIPFCCFWNPLRILEFCALEIFATRQFCVGLCHLGDIDCKFSCFSFIPVCMRI